VSVLMTGEDASDSPDVLNLSGGEGREAQATDVLAIADPPQHTRQRRVANRAFTMRRVKNMEENIRALSHSLIDQFEGGEVDWVKSFAIPLPMTIIIQLLGFPLEDMPQLKRWSDASVALLSGINSAEELAEHGTKINQMIGYLAARYDEAYQQPGDNLLGDLIKEAKIDDEEFGRDEIVSMLVQLLSAGNETTASLIGSAMWLLLQDSELQTQLRQNPDKIDNFIEEVLRLESPFHGHFRLVTRDTTLAGTALRKGDRLMLLWSSTGRDKSQFKDPGAVRLDREKPKSHLAFGYGIHHCIGAALARAEARIAFEAILERTAELSLSSDNDFSHIPSLFIRSLQQLNIEIS
jgi:cytochrome P450